MLGILLNALFLYSFAFAYSIHPDFASYNQSVQEEILYSQEVEMVSFDKWEASSSEKAAFLEMINSQGLEVFNIWGDTLLGGEYTEVGGDWWIQDVKAYFYENSLIAFSGVVRNHAVYYGDSYCDGDYFSEHNVWNDECVEKNLGYFSEKFFIDTNGDSIWMSDVWGEFLFKDPLRTL